jgi:hypothetical protein
MLEQGGAERMALRGPRDHQLQRSLCLPDRAHAVVNTAGAEPALSDAETGALVLDEVGGGHPDVVEDHFGVAVALRRNRTR